MGQLIPLRRHPSSQDHRCDDRCVCPLHTHPLPLLYAPSTGEHACLDVDCLNGHGMVSWGRWGRSRPS